MIHLHLDRVYSNSSCPIVRDGPAIDALFVLSSDFAFGGKVRAVSNSELLMETPGLGYTDVHAYSGTPESLVPVLQGAYLACIVMKQPAALARLKELIENPDALAARLAELTAQDVRPKASVIGIPLKLSEPADIHALYEASRRMDLSGLDVIAAFELWQETGDSLADFLREFLPAQKKA